MRKTSAELRSRSANVGAFLTHYREAWAEITGERLLSFWHPQGLVAQPATGDRVTPSELAAQLDAVKKILPDLRLTPVRWATTGSDTIFIQWTMTATVTGRRLEWSGVDVFTIRGALAKTGESYADPTNVIRQVSPEVVIPDLYTVLAKAPMS